MDGVMERWAGGSVIIAKPNIKESVCERKREKEGWGETPMCFAPSCGGSRSFGGKKRKKARARANRARANRAGEREAKQPKSPPRHRTAAAPLSPSSPLVPTPAERPWAASEANPRTPTNLLLRLQQPHTQTPWILPPRKHPPPTPPRRPPKRRTIPKSVKVRTHHGIYHFNTLQYFFCTNLPKRSLFPCFLSFLRVAFLFRLLAVSRRPHAVAEGTIQDSYHLGREIGRFVLEFKIPPRPPRTFTQGKGREGLRGI
jgi:hypothetical protein